MNKLSFKDLSIALDVKQATINVAVTRSKLIPIVENGKKLIDVKDDFNKVWIDTQIVKGKTFDINRVYNPAPKVKETDQDEIVLSKKEKPKDNSQVRNLEIDKKKLEIKNLKNKDKLDRMKIQKMQGDLIPFELAGTVSLYALETFRTTFSQSVKRMANIYKERLGITHKQFISIQKELIDSINEISKEGKENIISGLDGIVKEYQEVRSQGESK